MLSGGWSATAGIVTTSTRSMWSIASRQTRTLIFCGTTPTRLVKSIVLSRSYRPRSRTVGSDASMNVGVTSSDLVEIEYADLNLKELCGDGQIGRLRIRQHVNPLSASFSRPVQVPDWDDVFKDSNLPLMVDIGSGSGRFLIWLAKRFPCSRNYLGLEIRHKLVQRCQFWVQGLSLRNIHFISCNVTNSFERLVLSYPGPVKLVTILFPDPHFKNKHHKRRVLQAPLVDSILKNLTAGGQVLVQSDVLQVAMEMRDRLDLHADVLKHTDCSFQCDQDGWLQYNPLGVRTEREIHAELEGAAIYRRLYQKLD